MVFATKVWNMVSFEIIEELKKNNSLEIATQNLRLKATEGNASVLLCINHHGVTCVYV